MVSFRCSCIILTMLLFGMMPTEACAKLYKCTAFNGKVVFTDLGCDQKNNETAEVITPASVSKFGNKPLKHKSSGTAWVISESYVVTNYHVVEGHRRFRLVQTDGRVISAVVFLKNKQDDLAILKVSDSTKLPPPLSLAYLPARLGDEVFTIGYPFPKLMGYTSKLTNGTISSMKGLKSNSSLYQISVPIQGGNSGGPLLNMKGEVVGIIVSKFNHVNAQKYYGVTTENVNYAIKEEVLTRMLPKNFFPQKKALHFPNNFSIADLADKINSSIMLIVCD